MAAQRAFQGVILDVDGTLVDSNEGHARAFAEALAERGLTIPFERARRLIGMGADQLIPELIGRYDEGIAERKKEIFRQKYLPHLRPTPGAQALLRQLKKDARRLAVASSAGEDELAALLDVVGARKYLAARTTADDAERSKPDPGIVQAALSKLALPPERCVLIGDTPYDAQAAARARVAFIGVRCGGWSEPDLTPALGVYADPAALIPVFRRFP